MITKYVRPQGPICYEKQIFDFDSTKEIDKVACQLLASNLTWYWESEPSHNDPNYYSTNVVPSKRPLTKLSADNLTDFVEDLIEVDLENYGRFIALFGADSEFESASYDEAIASFIHNESGLIQTVIIRIGDSVPQYIFVTHCPGENITRLLEVFGITAASSTETRSYERLYLAKLESILRIEKF